MRRMRYPLVIFDFDGTLADSFPFFVKAQHALAQKHGFRAIEDDRVDALRRLRTHELLRELGFPKWTVPIVAADFIRMMRGAPPVPLFPGVADMLRHLRHSGARLAILTSNSVENVRRVLDAELMEAIELIDGGAHVLGKHRRIARMLKQAKADASQAIYIGDQVSDGEAAKRVGVAFGAVGWGYAHADTLRAMGAEEFFETVPELGRLAVA
jgi:phosphoglycolate phosphatase